MIVIPSRRSVKENIGRCHAFFPAKRLSGFLSILEISLISRQKPSPRGPIIGYGYLIGYVFGDLLLEICHTVSLQSSGGICLLGYSDAWGDMLNGFVLKLHLISISNFVRLSYHALKPIAASYSR